MIYRLLFRLVFTRLDAETAHEFALRLLSRVTSIRPLDKLLRRLLARRDESLRVRALGLEFPSPLGIAAGFDKNAGAFRGLASLGFGFVEVGTVTALPQSGNPRPRIFRLPSDRALINRMGFPNAGADEVASRLRGPKGDAVVGVNVGRSKAAGDEGTLADYEASIRVLAPGADYLVLNVSSPNTPGLRDLQAADRLEALVRRARQACGERRVPILVKIAPDLTDREIDEIADLALRLGVEGLVAVNTTVDRSGVSGKRVDRAGSGGLSGRPLRRRSLEVLLRLHERVGERVCLVSVGGIESAEDVWERIRAGATLVQAYTGFVYGGPLWPYRLNRGLVRLVRESGRRSIGDVVGTAADGITLPAAAGIVHQRALPGGKHLDLGSRV